jgi:hypothetical protein
MSSNGFTLVLFNIWTDTRISNNSSDSRVEKLTDDLRCDFLRLKAHKHKQSQHNEVARITDWFHNYRIALDSWWSTEISTLKGLSVLSELRGACGASLNFQGHPISNPSKATSIYLTSQNFSLVLPTLYFPILGQGLGERERVW